MPSACIRMPGPLRSYLTFHKFEEQIRDCHNFLSCYRGCMVNMDRIQEAADDGFLLDNGETVQDAETWLCRYPKSLSSVSFFVRRRKISAFKNPIMVLKVCKTTIQRAAISEMDAAPIPCPECFPEKTPSPCLFEENLFNCFLLRSAVYCFWPGSVPG